MRKFQPNDAPELARLLHTLWPDDNPDPARIARVSLETRHVTLIEEAGEYVVGFVDAFSTIAADGSLRWEVDLLGVHPDYRQRGIARRLVTAAVEAGRDHGAKVARALIRVGNTASINTFLRCGFTADPIIRDLYVADASGETVAAPLGVQLVPVETLTYDGTWVEGNLSLDALRHSRAVGKGTIGALIPAGTLVAEDAGFEPVAQFQWVTRTL